MQLINNQKNQKKIEKSASRHEIEIHAHTHTQTHKIDSTIKKKKEKKFW
jgi:hypothetical protein